MKTNFITSCILFSVMIFTAGCRKEIKDNPAKTEAQLQSIEQSTSSMNTCRLIFATNSDPSGSQDHTFHYNDKGLADEWNIANYGLFTQEYNAQGKLKKSTLSQNGDVLWATYFFYNGGDKVIKEITTDATGADTTDIAYYKYNAQGYLVKVQSFLNDWVATAKYTSDGNISASELFFGGFPVYSAFYTYDKHYKNPYLAVPGIDHAYPYYTPADFFYRKWLYSGEKQVGYDENGNPIVSFAYAPSKTKWQAEPKNYIASATYVDLLSGGSFRYNYAFENCGSGVGKDLSDSYITAPTATNSAGKLNLMMLLKRNPSKSMKEQVDEFRQQLKKLKN